MARCDTESRTKVALMPRLKRLYETQQQGGDTYGYQPVRVQVLDIFRRFLFPIAVADTTQLERLYRPYITEGTLYLNILSVIDCDSQVVSFHMHPKFNKDMDRHKLKCGDFINLTTYACRLFEGLDLYFEICGFEFCETETSSEEWCSWQYNLQTTKEECEAISNMPCSFKRALPLHLWHESIPLWPINHKVLQEIPDAVKSIDMLARFCGRADIQHIDMNWKTIRKPFPFLVCRIRTRGNHEFYRKASPGSSLPIKINLTVYDGTGGCSVVIWDEAVNDAQAAQLHEGTVIMLHNYDVKRDFSNKFRVDFGTLKRFPIELHVQDEGLFGKKALEIVPPEFVSHAEVSRHLPMIDQPCNSFTDINERRNTRYNNTLNPEDVFPVAGVVVGLSRYYRLRREVQQNQRCPIGRFYTFRWVELYEPKSRLCLNVEVFINKQVENYTALEVGDVAAFTFVRLKQAKASPIKEDTTHVTTTQNSELYVLKKSAAVDVPCPDIPTVIRKEMRRIKILIGDQRDLEPRCWLGGAHQFVNTYYTNVAIQKLFTTDERTFQDLPNFLKNLAFWESKNMLFSGQIVLVEYCEPEPTSCEILNDKSGKIQQNSKVLAKADCWDAMKGQVPVYGSTCPHYLTLPLKFTEPNRQLLHRALNFPEMNMYELELARNDEVEEEHFEVLSRGYYRIVILRHDKKVAVSSFFLPIVANLPPTLIQALHLSHESIRKPMESPVIKNMDYSFLESQECAQTAKNVLNKEIDAILQTRCMGMDDYEIIFCQLYFKNSEDECLY